MISRISLAWWFNPLGSLGHRLYSFEEFTAKRPYPLEFMAVNSHGMDVLILSSLLHK